jgi:PAS domain S-box-containing protein
MNDNDTPDLSSGGDPVYRSVFMNMAKAGCIDKIIYENGKAVDYRILDVNHAYEKIMGISRGEACGSLASELYGTGKAPFLDIFSQVAETGEPAEFEDWFEPAGRYLHFTVGSPGPGLFSTVINDITARKEVEKKLHDSEQTYRGIIDSMNDTVWMIDFGGNLLDFNKSAETLLGYSRDELLEIGLFGIHTSIERHQIMELVRSMPRDKAQIFETTHRTKDGRVIPVEVCSSIVNYRGSDMILSIARDIKRRKDAETAIRQRDEQFKNLIERMPDGVYKSTHEGRFVEVNPAMVSMLGYDSKQELMSVDIKSQLYFEPSDRESMTLMEQMEELGIFRMRKKDGSEIWVEDHGWYVTDDSGTILFHEGILRDVTERKNAELKLIRQAEELHDLNATKDKFFSIIAHDLKGPFNAILGFTDLLLENYLNLDGEAVEKSLQAISGASRQAYALLENLLMWSRTQTGQMPFVPEKVNLREKINTSISLLEIQADNKRIAIAREIPGHITITADRNMIGTVIRNILSNAIKFTPVGGRVIVMASEVGPFVEVSVTDTGVGIPAANLQNIFRIENKTSTLGTEKERGSGLGLILCKEFMEKNGGSIGIISEPGKGTTIILRFAISLA